MAESSWLHGYLLATKAQGSSRKLLQIKPNSKSCAVPSGFQAGLESFALSFSDRIMCLTMWIEHSVTLMLQAPISC